MFLKKTVIVLCSVLVFGDAGVVDNLKKCSIRDNQCQKSLFESAMKEASKTGVPELDIPPFDPMALKDVDLPILNVADLHLNDGVLKGLKKCTINKFNTNIEQGNALLDLTCDLTLKGHYKASSSSPIIKSILGADNLKGDGNVKIKLEKLNIKMNLNFFLKEQNGQIYFKEKSKPTTKFDVLGRAVFVADHLYLGDQDASARISNLLTENWKLVVGTVGNQFMQKAVETLRVLIRKFFDNVPSSSFITDDLTPYVK